MGKSYNQILQEIVNLDYDELLTRAELVLPDVLDGLNNVARDGDGAGFLLALIGRSIVADGQFSDLEYQFVCQLLDLRYSFRELKDYLEQYCDDEWEVLLYRVIDAVDGDTRGGLLLLCLYVMAVDERISKEENALVQRLLA